MPRIRKSLVITVLLSVFFSFIGLQSAYAVFGVADTSDGILAALLQNATTSLATAKSTLDSVNSVRSFTEQTLRTTKDAYLLAKHSAEVASDAARAGQEMRNFSSNRFGDAFTRGLEAAFPDLAYLRREAQHPGLDQTYGGFKAALSYCLSDYIESQYREACTRLAGKTDEQRRRAMLDLAFGSQLSAPPRTPTSAEQLRTRLIQEQIADTLKRIDEADKMYRETALKLADLREQCLRSMPGSRSGGYLQTVRDDYDRLSKDLGVSTSGQPTVTDAKNAVQTEKCKQYHDYSTSVSAETAQYNAIINDATARLNALKIAYDVAERGEEKDRQQRQVAGLASQLKDVSGKAGQRKVRYNADGYDLFEGTKP
jgi:hypothetical protein